ncbi:hypothetical protein TRSC58_07302 [Trypanosoma rangeli SC58]|uniref:Uncharacterized protein n=1 Tax=Trypanosoma rangeli SC58 TaxID=429131 RepID=A0A061ITK8_TRYRA|nr:hypothetical protein TRSC58_07302 [Trypanosoma rangeli SC58]
MQNFFFLLVGVCEGCLFWLYGCRIRQRQNSCMLSASSQSCHYTQCVTKGTFGKSGNPAQLSPLRLVREGGGRVRGQGAQISFFLSVRR